MIRKIIGAIKKILKKVFYIILMSFFLILVVILAAYAIIDSDLPDIEKLTQYEEKASVITNVFDCNGEKIGEFYKEKRVLVTIDKMPAHLPEAFIAAEDARFYSHQGIDLRSIFRAFTVNLKAGRIVQGGSTITQQVARGFFLSRKKKYIRKLREAILAYRIDKNFSKEEILFLYLNQIYLGHRSYGVAAAAQNYFQKDVKDLNLAECSMLAGLPQAPSRYSPFKHMKRAKKRQRYVLKRMLVDRYITRDEYDEALKTEVVVKPIHSYYQEEAPYFTEYVRQYVENKYGLKALYEEGLKIYTTVDKSMQKAARESVKKGLLSLDKRMGYKGPITHLNAKEIFYFVNSSDTFKEDDDSGVFQGVVTDINSKDTIATVRFNDEVGYIKIDNIKWAREINPKKNYYNDRINKISSALNVGDLIYVKVKKFNAKQDIYELSLEQEPIAQSALLCIETDTGYVKAMIGGRKFVKSQFNRAIQSKRQPGSAFKPIIYAAALDKGYTTADLIIDEPITFKDKIKIEDELLDFVWRPKNYESHFFGYTSFREALIHSRNLVTIKILQDIGIDYVKNYAKKLGIDSYIDNNLSIALGSFGISLLELVKSYSVFANKGELIEPIFIVKILDKDGNVIEENEIRKKRVIEDSTAYIITNLLEDVVKEGTGKKVKQLKRSVAGKTGTTNDLYDAWFIGYTPQYVTGVWVGLDTEASMGRGETGSRAASPIWLDFMQKALSDEPELPFETSKNVTFERVTIKSKDGKIIKKDVLECFKDGTEPEQKTENKKMKIPKSIF